MTKIEIERLQQQNLASKNRQREIDIEISHIETNINYQKSVIQDLETEVQRNDHHIDELTANHDVLEIQLKGVSKNIQESQVEILRNKDLIC